MCVAVGPCVCACVFDIKGPTLAVCSLVRRETEGRLMAGTDAALTDMNRLINSKFAPCLTPTAPSVSDAACFSQVPVHISWLMLKGQIYFLK